MDVTVAEHPLSINEHRIEENIRPKVERYLSGERITFSEAVDLSDLTDFQQRVIRAVRRVPYGETVTYTELAEMIERPDAVRAIANACGVNPCPIIIPCHRVVGKNSLGGYSDGGPEVKRALLALEDVSC